MCCNERFWDCKNRLLGFHGKSEWQTNYVVSTLLWFITWSIKNKGGSRSKMSKNLDILNWIVPPNSWMTLLLANCIKSSKFILGTLFRRFGSAWWCGAPISAFSIVSFLKWSVLSHQKCFQILNMVEGKIISREGEVTLDYFPRFLEADVRNVLLLILFSRSRSSLLPEKIKTGRIFKSSFRHEIDEL